MVSYFFRPLVFFDFKGSNLKPLTLLAPGWVPEGFLKASLKPSLSADRVQTSILLEARRGFVLHGRARN